MERIMSSYSLLQRERFYGSGIANSTYTLHTFTVISNLTTMHGLLTSINMLYILFFGTSVRHFPVYQAAGLHLVPIHGVSQD